MDRDGQAGLRQNPAAAPPVRTRATPAESERRARSLPEMLIQAFRLDPVLEEWRDLRAPRLG